MICIGTISGQMYKFWIKQSIDQQKSRMKINQQNIIIESDLLSFFHYYFLPYFTIIFFLILYFFISMPKPLNQFDDDIPLKQIRSFAPKLIRQLNFKQNKKFKRQKKLLKLNPLNPIENQNHKIQSNIISKSSNHSKTSHQKNHSKLQQTSKLKMSNKHSKIIDLNSNKAKNHPDLQGFSGKTQILFQNGAKFTGNLLNDKMLQGTFEFTNGFKYEGGFMHSQFFGPGTLQFPDGKIISGDWNAQKIVGNGQIKYKTGEIYYGEIDSFKKNGFGYLFLKDGSKFIGHFKDGKIKGKGSYFIEDKLIGEGNWEEGQLIQSLPVDLLTYCSTFVLPRGATDETSIFHPQKIYGKQFGQFGANSKEGKVQSIFISLKSISQDREQSTLKGISQDTDLY